MAPVQRSAQSSFFQDSALPPDPLQLQRRVLASLLDFPIVAGALRDLRSVER